jgi:hypothetical protein
MIADQIRDAQAEQEVFHLLNAYIEAVGCGGKSSYLPEDMATLPSCANDVMQRCSELMGALDAASKQLDDKTCLATREALHIFSNALNRLKLLEHEKLRSLAGVAVHGMRGAVSRLDAR